MPAYTYTGDDARTYPTLGIEAKPAIEARPATGDEPAIAAEPATVAEFDERPPAPAGGEEPAPVPDGARYAPQDGRWEPMAAAPQATAKKKTSPPPAGELPTPAAVPADTPKES